jgi:hypothetical protein
MTPGLVCVRVADVWIFSGLMAASIVVAVLVGYAVGTFIRRRP